MIKIYKWHNLEEFYCIDYENKRCWVQMRNVMYEWKGYDFIHDWINKELSNNNTFEIQHENFPELRFPHLKKTKKSILSSKF